MTQSFVHIRHARTQEQIDVMNRIEKDGVCPFCMEHFRKYHPKPILFENANWIITENMSPYDGSAVHLLLVHKTHTSFPAELTDASRIDYFAILDWAIRRFELPAGAIVMRFGEPRLTGGTVDHCHAHLVVGDTTGTGDDPIKTKLGYKKIVSG